MILYCRLFDYFVLYQYGLTKIKDYLNSSETKISGIGIELNY